MHKIGLIIQREYMTRVMKKSFVIMTLLAPFIFVGFYAIVFFLAAQKTEHKDVVIYDNTGYFEKFLPAPTNEITYHYKGGADYSDAVHSFKREKDMQDKDILIWLPNDVLLSKTDLPKSKGQAKLIYRDAIGLRIETSIKDTLQAIRKKYKLQDLEITSSIIAEIDAAIPFSLKKESNLNEKGEEIEVQADFMGAYFIGMAFSFMIFLFIFMYGMQVMRGVIEEKTNRVVEIIVSSVRPFVLMMGKVIGIAVVGLTQFLAWIILSGILLTITMLVLGAEMDMTSVDMQQVDANIQDSIVQTIVGLPWMNIIFSFFFFFIGGYLVYAALFAAIGSAVDNETDTQQFVFPVIIPLLLGFYIAQFSIFSNPNGVLMQIFSYFPLTSPVVMLMRVTIDSVQWWEVVISLTILFATFIGVTWLAGKIYKTGILMYGKKASFKEIIKWVRYQ